MRRWPLAQAMPASSGGLLWRPPMSRCGVRRIRMLACTHTHVQANETGCMLLPDCRIVCLAVVLQQCHVSKNALATNHAHGNAAIANV